MNILNPKLKIKLKVSGNSKKLRQLQLHTQKT
jgi:hypothetical protein